MQATSLNLQLFCSISDTVSIPLSHFGTVYLSKIPFPLPILHGISYIYSRGLINAP